MEPDESADDAGQPEASDEEGSAQRPQEPESSENGPAAGSVPVPGRPPRSRREPRPAGPRKVTRVSPSRPPRREAPVHGLQMPAGPQAQEPAGGPARVILIERSMGVQVGRENDQVSVYLATLPRASFGSAQRLAETLLSPDAPWSRDVFSHDARPSLPDTKRVGRGTSSSGIIEGPRGDTLVIVRNSQGVQVGERNVQRNEFTVRVRAVAVHADTVGMTPDRLEWISRLRANPGDRAAARLLAEDLGRAARDRLQADLTARVRQLAGNPQIRRWAGGFRHLVGRQIGGHGNRASVQVDIRTGEVDIRALQRSLGAAAEWHQPPPREPRPAPPAARYRPRQSRGARDTGRQRPGPDRRPWPDRGGR
jgi:hypothetical protein